MKDGVYDNAHGMLLSRHSRYIGRQGECKLYVVDGKVWSDNETARTADIYMDYFEFCDMIRAGQLPEFVGDESFHLGVPCVGCCS